KQSMIDSDQPSEGVGWIQRSEATNDLFPEVLSDIILKLMSKNAEDRYQSAFGLKADLQNCLQQLKETGKIGEFEIGLNDISDHLSIPQKLYGREEETKTLLEAFERVSGGQSEMMLVAGYSGVGKSSLIREIHQPIARRQGYFISGKFDQFKRDIPYTALVHAFQEIVQQIMAESSHRFAVWKDKLQKALGPNGQVIIDVIPEVERIIGRQPAAPEVGPEENRNRFRYVLENFIGAFADDDRPLVLFLDDLQWADLPSLQLIELFMTVQEQNLFLIGAYRDNEVDAGHPLLTTLENVRKAAVDYAKSTAAPVYAPRDKTTVAPV
ncbi:MAG: AAA family ATPase, partial [Proteobacteria bacterium]|nr:AAA family ATPase [Pseudomonadota bacterium]